MKNIVKIIHILQQDTKGFIPPLIDQVIDEFGCDPFLILIACLLSLRSKDVVTINVCRDLFVIAKSANQIVQIPRTQLEKIIYKTGFYKNKAKVLHDVSSVILKKFNGLVPMTYDELIAIKGIGPKTANLVLGMAFNIPAICVDTHVHRISNRLGLIKTKTVEETQSALEHAIARKYWISWNGLLVIWGQNICLPRGPKCKQCGINKLCKKVGVE
jgi:endonuclease III